MRFLLDQDVYAATASFLRELGHDVVTAAEAGRERDTDEELLDAAQREGRILVTRDRDFGSLVFVGNKRCGVLYLRVSSPALAAGHEQLASVLAAYTEDQLAAAFVTVEPGRHRFRRLPAR